MSQYTKYSPVGGGSGTVTDVTATSPLASSGGTTPDISITGIIPVANGGTGSATQNFLSNTDGLYSLSNTVDPTKLQLFNLSGQTTGTALTLEPVNTSNMTLHIPQVSTASGAGMALIQDETTGFIFGYGIASSIGGANSMFQLANASTANRAQIKLHSYFAGASVSGVSTLTSRSGVIGTNSAVVAGQDYSKWTAQAGATTPGSAPISGTWSFKANTVNSLTVTSDFHLQLTNLAGTLADRLYLSSEGLLTLPGYVAGVAQFDASGNISSTAPGTSGNVLTSDGTAWVSSAPAGSGANTSLSNLGVTSVNADINPDADYTWSLGVINRWLRIKTNILFAPHIRDASNDDVIATDLRQLVYPGLYGSPIALDFSGNEVFAVTGKEISLTSSVASKIRFVDGSEGTAGDVWTSTDTLGNGAWATPSGGSAPTSRITLDTFNGFGSTNTAQMIFLNITDNSGGADLSYATASTGDTITINTTGMYSIVMNTSSAGADDCGYGILINASATEMQTFPFLAIPTHRLAYGYIPVSAATILSCSGTQYLTAGDVVTFCQFSNTIANPVASSYVQVTITRVN